MELLSFQQYLNESAINEASAVENRIKELA